MLVVVFRLGAADCGIDGRSVVEVVPLVALQAAPRAPAWLLGRLAYRGATLPVVDVAALMGQGALPRVMSSRVLVVRHGADGRLLGLAAPAVLDTVTIPDPAATADAVVMVPGMGEVRLVSPTGLLPPPLADQCFAAEARP